MRYVFAALAGALSLSACATTRVPPGDPVPLENLIRQIKRDIGEYNNYALKAANEDPLDNACKGKIDLTIKSVVVSVTTSAKISEGVTAGAQLQPEAFLKIGVSGGLGKVLGNSQVLTFGLEPVSKEGLEIAAQPSQLYLVLTNLRESLLKAGDTTPCLKFPDKDQKNSVEFGFTATNTSSASLGVNLFIFALGASHSDERVAAHKITINFVGEGQSFQVE